MFQGAITDDIDYYNRTHEMFHVLTSKPNRDNDDVEGFSYRWDDTSHYLTAGPTPGVVAPVVANYNGVPANGSRTVSFKPL